jgi:hypothetical protein
MATLEVDLDRASRANDDGYLEGLIKGARCYALIVATRS